MDDVAKKEDLSLILEKSRQGVLWAKKEMDLTDKIVEAYEKQNPKKK